MGGLPELRSRCFDHLRPVLSSEYRLAEVKKVADIGIARARSTEAQKFGGAESLTCLTQTCGRSPSVAHAQHPDCFAAGLQGKRSIMFVGARAEAAVGCFLDPS